MLMFRSVPERGSHPRYTDSDIFWVMYMMSGTSRTGRKNLCSGLGLGEGSVRSILALLHDCGLADTFQTGSALNETGHELLNAIPVIPVSLDAPEGTPGGCHCTVIVRDRGQFITNGMRERDEGIRAGGLGCTTLVFRNGHLFMPPDWDLDVKSPEYAEYVRSMGVMGPDDVMIIGSADDAHSARASATNAAFSLIR